MNLNPSYDDMQESETTPSGGEAVNWEVVAKLPGLVPAQIVAGRLESEGIPARAWQEGAGQALGLTVGLLGNGYVLVPEEYKEQAIAILDEEVAFLDEEDAEFDASGDS